jgi:hypothetical protein
VLEDYAARPLNLAPEAIDRSALQTRAVVDVDSVPRRVAPHEVRGMEHL